MLFKSLYLRRCLTGSPEGSLVGWHFSLPVYSHPPCLLGLPSLGGLLAQEVSASYDALSLLLLSSSIDREVSVDLPFHPASNMKSYVLLLTLIC